MSRSPIHKRIISSRHREIGTPRFFALRESRKGVRTEISKGVPKRSRKAVLLIAGSGVAARFGQTQKQLLAPTDEDGCQQCAREV